MKKIVLTVVAVFSVLLVLTGCPGAAGGTNSGKIDYLARLIGTWKTKGYDKGEFVYVTNTGFDPAITYDIKSKIVITQTSFSGDATYKNSSNESVIKNEFQSDTIPIEFITESYFQLQGVSKKTYYKIIGNKLYLYNEDFLYWEKE